MPYYITAAQSFRFLKPTTGLQSPCFSSTESSLYLLPVCLLTTWPRHPDWQLLHDAFIILWLPVFPVGHHSCGTLSLPERESTSSPLRERKLPSNLNINTPILIHPLPLHHSLFPSLPPVPSSCPKQSTMSPGDYDRLQTRYSEFWLRG